MAIQLQNSVFIHIPKTGGRWVKEQIVHHVKDYHFIGDPIYDAHESPDTNLPVFAFVRHPITMANSLWCHRSRKRSNRRAFQWDWQQTIPLERECGDANFINYFHKIALNPGILTDYYLHFLRKYKRIHLGRMETIAPDLISILDTLKENYDKGAIIANAKKKIGHASKPVVLPHELIHKIMENEGQFCEQFGYTADEVMAA